MAASDDTQRAIGRLEGKVEEALNLLKESSTSRAKLYEGQESLRLEMHDIGSRIEDVERSVGVMEPLVSDYGRLKQRGLGILAVIGFIWLFIGGLILNGLEWVVSMAVKAFTGGS